MRLAGHLDMDALVATITFAPAVGFPAFETHPRLHTLPGPSGEPPKLEAEALALLQPFLDRPEDTRRKPIRLLGLRVEKLA